LTGFLYYALLVFSYLMSCHSSITVKEIVADQISLKHYNDRKSRNTILYKAVMQNCHKHLLTPT